MKKVEHVLNVIARGVIKGGYGGAVPFLQKL